MAVQDRSQIPLMAPPVTLDLRCANYGKQREPEYNRCLAGSQAEITQYKRVQVLTPSALEPD